MIHYDTQDLELLGGREAASEVLEDLKTAGLSPADRAKVRLLVGDQEHLQRLLSLHEVAGDKLRNSRADATAPRAPARRSLQTDEPNGGGGISPDAIAIMITGLSAVVGYILQARQATAAEHAQAEIEAERAQRDKAAAALQRQTQVQIEHVS
eukprot:SAG31_NODE_1813_length_7211_cov_9.203600_3_plen_153_part_00